MKHIKIFENFVGESNDWKADLEKIKNMGTDDSKITVTFPIHAGAAVKKYFKGVLDREKIINDDLTLEYSEMPDGTWFLPGTMFDIKVKGLKKYVMEFLERVKKFLEDNEKLE